MVGWYGLVAPGDARAGAGYAGPRGRGSHARPQVRKSIEDMAMEPVFMPGPAFRDQISSELAIFGAVGKRAGITLD